MTVTVKPGNIKLFSEFTSQAANNLNFLLGSRLLLHVYETENAWLTETPFCKAFRTCYHWDWLFDCIIIHLLESLDCKLSQEKLHISKIT